MRQLLPVPVDEVDVESCYLADDRPSWPDRPWVVVNMATTADGATAIDGRSGGIGGPGDRLAFHALRSAADVILVGAGTVRAEGYRPVAVPPSHQARRHAAGRPEPARVALVTRSLDLEPGAALFAGPAPIVFTVAGAAPDRVAALRDVAEVIEVGVHDVDLGRALRVLGELGARCVVAEGGPTLNGQLIAADLVDELCITTAPTLAGGSSSRPARGAAPPAPRSMRLVRLLTDGRDLLARYVVERARP